MPAAAALCVCRVRRRARRALPRSSSGVALERIREKAGKRTFTRMAQADEGPPTPADLTVDL